MWKVHFVTPKFSPEERAPATGVKPARVQAMSPTTTLPALRHLERPFRVETFNPDNEALFDLVVKKIGGRKTAPPWDPHAGPSAALCVQHPLKLVGAALLWTFPSVAATGRDDIVSAAW